MAAASAVSRPCDDGPGRRPGDADRRIRCGSRGQACRAVGSGDDLPPSPRRAVPRTGSFRIAGSGIDSENPTAPDHRTRVRDPPLRRRAREPDLGQPGRRAHVESRRPVAAPQLGPLSRQPRVRRDAGPRCHRQRNRASVAAAFVPGPRARRDERRSPAADTE